MSTKTLDPDLEYYIGKLHIDFESAGQAKIASMLDKYGIPFFYKQPTLVTDNSQRKILYPDFTLPTYNNTVIEYISNNNINKSTNKKTIYKQNDIASLFLNNSELTKPNWQEQLYDKLEDMYHKPLSYHGSKQVSN